MKLWAPKAAKATRENDNRDYVIMAIVFLLAGILIARLFYLQVIASGFYTKIAINQHSSSRVLEPSRGRIFISDSGESDGKLFPLATNKDYAILFAVPKNIENPDLTARQLYYLFDKQKIKTEVDLLFSEREKEMTKTASSTVVRTLTEAESLMLSVQKNDELKKRRDDVIKVYVEKLSNKNDVYEPLANKIDEDELKKIYAAFKVNNPDDFKPNDDGTDRDVKFNTTGIEIKNERVLRIKPDGDEILEVPGIQFVYKPYRYYPEKNIGSHLLGYVGNSDDKMKGNYGLEGFFNEELTGKAGSLKSERGAGGGLIIVSDRQYVPAKNGSDLILTIDRSIEYAVCVKLSAAVKRHGADSGTVIVMDPKTGAIIAMCSAPDFDPNNFQDVKDIYTFNNKAIFDQYEPGSIFKVITMAMGIDMGVVTPETTYEDKGAIKIAGFTIMNSDKKANGVQTMTQVLEKSLNTGVIFVTKKVGFDNFDNYINAFGFGERFGIEMEGEGKGSMRALKIKKNTDLYHYTASYGQGISVTALQMVAAFGAIANGGIMMQPYVVKEIVSEDGTRTTTEPKQIRRVISERAASLMGGMLVNVVEHGHGQKAGVKGYYVGGKTGTAQVPRKDGRGYDENNHIGSFAGYAPIDDPKFVMIARIDHPRDVEWAESSAAPLFGEIADFILKYKKIAPTRQIDEIKK